MSLILEDESKRKILNGITHPRIFRRMIWEIATYAAKGHTYAVLDVPLLFESSEKFLKWFHRIIVVTCERDMQMQRLMDSRKMTERKSGLLIDAQMSLDQKASRADYIVDNSTNLEDLKTQVSISISNHGFVYPNLTRVREMVHKLWVAKNPQKPETTPIFFKLHEINGILWYLKSAKTKLNMKKSSKYQLHIYQITIHSVSSISIVVIGQLV